MSQVRPLPIINPPVSRRTDPPATDSDSQPGGPSCDWMMKVRTLAWMALVGCSWGCKKDEPLEAHQRLHTIELSNPLEAVQVTVAGRGDLTVSVFQREGRLVAAVIDRRSLSDERVEEIQRWEMLAKSNKEVACTTTNNLFRLKHAGPPEKGPAQPEASSRGTVVCSDTNGDGIPDYQLNADGFFEVRTIVFEESKMQPTSLDFLEQPAANPDLIFRLANQNEAIRPGLKSEGGVRPQSGPDGQPR